MNRRESLAYLLGTAAATASAQTTSAQTTSAMSLASAVDAIGSLVQKIVAAGTVKTAALYVQRGDESRSHAFGTANPDSMFLLGSITKPFTALAVMILADRGALKLSDPVMQYLPEFSEGERAKVTIEHLLTHTSGLPDQLPENNAMRARHAPLSEFVAATVRTPLSFAPGTQYQYQSMGILLAAEIVERLTKEPLPAFLAETVFAPLGMKRSVLGVGAFQKDDLVPMQTDRAAPEAGGGDPTAKSWDWNSDYWRHLAAPWGGAHASAGDVAILLREFLAPSGKVLHEATAREMIRNHTPGLGADRGLGFQLGAALGNGCSPAAFGHPGSTGTLAWADPATGTSFVLLTSLPKNVSGDLVLDPASDRVAGGDR
jgi:CubicO group peptidase (beta-lactamase class C family)